METSINGLIRDFCSTDDWQVKTSIHANRKIDVPLWQDAHKNDTDRTATIDVCLQLTAHQTEIWFYGVLNNNRLIRVFVSKKPYPAPALNLAYMPDASMAVRANAKLRKLYLKHTKTHSVLQV